MILKIGNYVDQQTGDIRDRYLVIGHTIKDAEVRTVGAKGTSMLSFGLSPGKDEPLINMKLWGYDAIAYDGLRRGTTIIADCYCESREYNGKTYTDYIPLNFLAVDQPKQTGTKRAKTVKPEDPNEGFVDIPVGDLPF